MKKIISSLVIVCLCLSLLTPLTVDKANAMSKAKTIAISQTKVYMTKNTSEKLRILYPNLSDKLKIKSVKWTTSNSNVATVSSKGVVKGKKAGNATITAKVKYINKYKTFKCKVYVYNKWARVFDGKDTWAYKVSDNCNAEGYSKIDYYVKVYAHYKPAYNKLNKYTGKNYIEQIKFVVKKNAKSSAKTFYTKKYNGGKKYYDAEKFLKEYAPKALYNEYKNYFGTRACMDMMEAYAKNHIDSSGKIDVHAAEKEIKEDYTNYLMVEYAKVVINQSNLSAISNSSIAKIDGRALQYLVNVQEYIGNYTAMTNTIINYAKQIEFQADAIFYFRYLNNHKVFNYVYDREDSLTIRTETEAFKGLYNKIIKL